MRFFLTFLFFPEILKLGWNMIRLSSAVALGNSLSSNTTLLYLDLSCNSLGKDGGNEIKNPRQKGNRWKGEKQHSTVVTDL